MFQPRPMHRRGDPPVLYLGPPAAAAGYESAFPPPAALRGTSAFSSHSDAFTLIAAIARGYKSERKWQKTYATLFIDLLRGGYVRFSSHYSPVTLCLKPQHRVALSDDVVRRYLANWFFLREIFLLTRPISRPPDFGEFRHP